MSVDKTQLDQEMSAKKKLMSKPKSSGPMDKFCKKIPVTEGSHSPRTVEKPCDKMAASAGSTTPLKPQGSAPVPCRILNKQEAEAHETHTFEWCWNDNKPTMLTCNQPGTVEELLRRSSQFRKIAEKNKHRELVILREGKAISSHFPCSLIKDDERLILKYVKAVKNPKTNENHCFGMRKGSYDKLLTFNLLTAGGKKVMKIMKNPALKSGIDEVTVYAYKDEKVKQALKRDGRFLDIIFKKNCRLSNTSYQLTAEMSNLVDHLDGKTFKIELCNKSDQPDSLPGSLEEPLISDSDGVQDPPQPSAAPGSGNESNPKEKSRDAVTHVKVIYQITNSEAMLRNMSNMLSALVKRMKTEQGSRLSPTQNLFRVEFGKSTQACREVKTMKKLMELSDSVCQVRVNGLPKGTGFLLFDEFVLTNGHVVEDIYDAGTGELRENVTVHFSFESVDQTEGGLDIAVEDVAGFEHSLDESGNKHDWSLLKLSGAPTLPGCLLKQLGLVPPKGGICIIGHPEGNVKRIDPCLIIPPESRSQVLEQQRSENPGTVQLEGSHYNLMTEPFPLITDLFFENVAQSLNQHRQALTYDTCFHCGSSGSPVFDEYCNVVALHTGGFLYRNGRGKEQSVIEYGQPLFVIIERIIVQLVHKRKFEPLQRFLACEYERHNIMMSNLKKLVQSRNLTAFEDALNNPVVKSDESLTSFFEFLTKKEEAVAMDTD